MLKVFITPADSVQDKPFYWYWISDNISKDGVVKRSSCHEKKAGINRAFIGNIGPDDVAYGKSKKCSVKYGGKILHIALKNSGQSLNIEIGIF